MGSFCSQAFRGADSSGVLRLQGDAKAELCDYLGEQGIDLLIVGYSAANRFKKAFTGGSLSTHMMQHAHCPVVVLPLKSMSWEDQDTLSQIPELRSASGEPLLCCVQTSLGRLQSTSSVTDFETLEETSQSSNGSEEYLHSCKLHR